MRGPVWAFKAFKKPTDREVWVIETKQEKNKETNHKRIKCVHGHRKDRCSQCGKEYLCPHNRRKNRCTLCGNGVSICLQHGKHKDSCKLCNGSQICSHDRHKKNCKPCGGKYCCVNDGCETTTTKAGTQCKTCCPVNGGHIKVSEKRLQWHLKSWADQKLIPAYLTSDRRISGINAAVCGPVRPDFFWDLGNWVLVLENDEQAHKDREPRCDHIRNQDIMNAFGQVPVYVIRFNPHAFKVCDITRKTGTVERMELLLKTLQDVLTKPSFEHHLTLHYMFYTCTQCKSSRQCSFQHVDRFKTMLEYGTYIDSVYPLSLFGTGQQQGPSPTAQH